MKKRLIIGSRGSKLALIQTNQVKRKLKSIGLTNVDIKEIKTSGDKNQEDSVLSIGGKGVFAKEIQKALLKGEIDLAVHSLKDLSASEPKGLCIAAYLKGADQRDVLISKSDQDLSELPANARIGTGSPRRSAEIAHFRDDLKIVPIRGNVETRIRKVFEEDYDACILAYAGVKRLRLSKKITDILPLEKFVPAPGQGVIVVETRSCDQKLINTLKKIDDKKQRLISEVEFGILKKLGATCETPIGIYSEIRKKLFYLSIFYKSENGFVKTVQRIPVKDSKTMVSEFYAILPDISCSKE